jgi:hypothetical protein
MKIIDIAIGNKLTLINLLLKRLFSIRAQRDFKVDPKE